jgi:NADP-dependent alcohol dehydrogenase
MLGHELTVLYGIDHARSLALVLPAMLTLRKQGKRDKLLQYAQRVWGQNPAEGDVAIDVAIAKTRDFFLQMQVPVKLSDYQLSSEAVDAVCAQLEKHRMTKLGEKRDVTLEMSRQVLEMSL